jgi:hypothetical protein
MVALAQLWLPILVSAVLVFIASSLIHMVLKWHNKDYAKLPNEDEVRAALQRGNPAPGQYVTPWALDMKDCNTPEMQKKFTDGPVGVIYLKRPGPMNMGPTLGQWFVYLLVVSFFVAYVASRALQPGTEYLRVFQIAGATGFIAYALGSIPAGIWMGKPWAVVIKEVIDGLIYGMVTGGAFGWLWPKM